MKKLVLAITTLFALSINAQTQAVTVNTGNPKMDKQLQEINEIAIQDIEGFKDEMNQTLSLPKTKTEELLKNNSPADIYMIGQTAQVTGKPVDEVAQVHEKNKDKGWGATAKELGIKPGSKEFHELKGKVKEKNKKTKKEKKEKDKNKGKSEEHNKDKEHGKNAEHGKPDDKGKPEGKGGKGKGKK